MKVIHHIDEQVPADAALLCLAQEKHLGRMRLFILLLSWIGLPLCLLHSRYIGTGQAHNLVRYPGASGWWQYYGLPPEWLEGNLYQRFISLYNNFYDGHNGDKRGEWSEIVNGKEKSLWSRIRWSGFRNFTNGMRNFGYFSVIPDECDEVEIWGHDFELDNKPKVDTGWWFIKAKKGRHTYYSFRAVNIIFGGDMAYNASIGFKLKPSHFTDGQDEAKGFTGRVSVFGIDEDGYKK